MHYNDHVYRWHHRQARSYFRASRRAMTAQGLSNMPPAYRLAHMNSEARALRARCDAHLEAIAVMRGHDLDAEQAA